MTELEIITRFTAAVEEMIEAIIPPSNHTEVVLPDLANNNEPCVYRVYVNEPEISLTYIDGPTEAFMDNQIYLRYEGNSITRFHIIATETDRIYYRGVNGWIANDEIQCEALLPTVTSPYSARIVSFDNYISVDKEELEKILEAIFLVLQPSDLKRIDGSLAKYLNERVTGITPITEEDRLLYSLVDKMLTNERKNREELKAYKKNISENHLVFSMLKDL